MPDPKPRILLVGHCIPDAYAIRSALNSLVPEAQVEFVSREDDLATTAPSSLLLINRALDGDFEAADGVELIRSLAGDAGHPRMMLITNFPDAQAAAQSAGALPGFSKREMYAAPTKARVRSALGLT